jgi:hypothetical protein
LTELCREYAENGIDRRAGKSKAPELKYEQAPAAWKAPEPVYYEAPPGFIFVGRTAQPTVLPRQAFEANERARVVARIEELAKTLRHPLTPEEMTKELSGRLAKDLVDLRVGQATYQEAHKDGLVHEYVTRFFESVRQCKAS